MAVRTLKRYMGPAVVVLCVVFVFGMLQGIGNRKGSGKVAAGNDFKEYVGSRIEKMLLGEFMPVLRFGESGSRSVGDVLVRWQIGEVMPIWVFGENAGGDGASEQMTMEMILKAEAQEGYEGVEAGDDGVGDNAAGGLQVSEGSVGNGTGDETSGDRLGGTVTGTEGGLTGEAEKNEWAALLEAENQAVRDLTGAGEGIVGSGDGAVGTGEGTANGDGVSGTGASGTGAAGADSQQGTVHIQGNGGAASIFIPHTTKLAQVDMAALSDYETLVQTFYTIDKSTMIGSDQLDAEKLSKVDMTISKSDPGPQILIYHTHSQEAFADSVEGDPSTTIVGVGERLTEILTNEYGYQVLHHTGEYDVPARDDAYSVALPEIEEILEDNPQIQVVIDLHRDAMDESTRLVTEIDGRPTARFMFFNGLSRTRRTGNISYLYNENLDGNLAFSFQMQKKAAEYYPGLTRRIYLKAYRYNMHLRPKTLLVELGAQNNTVEEAMNACDPLAHILDMVLSGEGTM